jgi:hypothetical protein
MWLWLFIFSAALNLLAIFYVRWLLKTIAVINKDIEDLTLLISEFSDHTKSIHELEMFYGDETLRSLIDHASQLSEKLTNLDLILNEEEYNAATETQETKED